MGISVKGCIGIKAAIRAIKQLELFPFIIVLIKMVSYMLLDYALKLRIEVA